MSSQPLEMVNADDELEGYFIYNDDDGNFKTSYSAGFDNIIEGAK